MEIKRLVLIQKTDGAVTEQTIGVILKWLGLHEPKLQVLWYLLLVVHIKTR